MGMQRYGVKVQLGELFYAVKRDAYYVSFLSSKLKRKKLRNHIYPNI